MKLVMIRWNDPTSTSDPMWQHREEIENLNTAPCITVGILMKETDDDLRVVLSSNPHAFSQAITIPKTAIKILWELRVK